MPREIQVIQSEDQNKKQYFTTPEFAELVGFHEQTLRYWDKTGRFKPHHRTPGGTRMYSIEQIKDLQEIFAADGLFNNPEERKLTSKRSKFTGKRRKTRPEPESPGTNSETNQDAASNPDRAKDA